VFKAICRTVFGSNRRTHGDAVGTGAPGFVDSEDPVEIQGLATRQSKPNKTNGNERLNAGKEKIIGMATFTSGLICSQSGPFVPHGPALADIQSTPIHK
jgi:hypothetical protein